MNLNVALAIAVQNTEGKKALQDTRDEVRGLGTEAGRTSAAMVAANDQAIASVQRVTQTLTGQTAAQRQLQQSVEAMIARGSPTDDASYRQRAADIVTYGQELDRLRAKYNPLFAASKEYERELEDLAAAQKVGAISGAEYEAELGRINQRYTLLGRQSAVAAGGLATVGGAARLTSFQLLNLSRQGNDVITMFALGASPMQIFASQAGQIYDALESGPKGLRGSLEAITAAGRSALQSLLAFAMTPPGLIMGATIAAVAGLAAYIVKTREDVRSLDDILKDHEEAIKRIANAYGLVGEKAKGAFSYETRDSIRLSVAANENELRIKYASSLKEDLDSILTNRGGLGGGNQFGPSQINRSEFTPFAEAIDYLRNTVRQGKPDILGFRQLVTDRWHLEPNSIALATTAQRLLNLTNNSADAVRALKELEAAKQRLESSVGPHGLPLRRGALSTEDMGAYDRALTADRIAIEREQQAFDAQRRAIYARSPSEIAAAARATAAAQYNNGENPEDRNRRINMAGQLAYLQAQHQIDEAQKDRKRSLDAALASQQLDLDLIGKTAGQIEQMRVQFQLMQELREEAERNNTKIDQDELDRIIAKSAAIGRYADAIARATLANELQFEREQMGRTPIEQTVASRLQGAGLAVDLDGQMAKEIRINEILKQRVELWGDIRDSGMDAIDRISDSAAKGFSDAGDVLESIAQDLQSQLVKLVVANPLKNAIYGAGLPTIADAGGVGGWLGTLLGQTANPAAGVSSIAGQSVGAMNVNAAVVNIGGAGGTTGGLLDSVKRMFSPANDNASIAAANGIGGGVAGQVWKFFTEKGLAPHHVAGIMGNLNAESGLNPNAVNPASGAYGLPQWLGSRLTALGPGAGLQDQLQFMWKELQGPENRAFQNLLASTDVRGATRAFAGFERAEGFSWNNPEGIALWEKRLSGANAALAKFGGVTGATTQSVGDFGQGLKAGLGEFGDGLGNLWSKLGSFMQSPMGGGSSWFQGLASSFGGIGGALSHMLSMSPAATMDIISGSWGAFAAGGATGGNDPRRVAGLVHEEEYVMDAPVVRALGVPFLDRLRAAAKSGRGFEVGGYARPHQPANDGSTLYATQPTKVERHYHDYAGVSVREEETEDGQGGRREDIYIEERITAAASRRGSSFNRALDARGARAPAKRR